jgi:nuclear transport factor 2 (NTF2) superfamily protein
MQCWGDKLKNEHKIHLVVTDSQNYSKYVPTIRKYTDDSMSVIVDRIKNGKYVASHDLNYQTRSEKLFKSKFKDFIDALLSLGCQIKLFEKYGNESKEITVAQLDRRIKRGREEKRNQIAEKETKEYSHRLIKKAIRLYKYYEPYDEKGEQNRFYQDYQQKISFYVKPKHSEKRQQQAFVKMIKERNIYELLWGGSLYSGIAQKLLWQGDTSCWEHFERSAYFRYEELNACFHYEVAQGNRLYCFDLERLAAALHYAVYVERYDLVSSLMELAQDLITEEQNSQVLDDIWQKSNYRPIVPFTNFMLEKIGFENPLQKYIMNSKSYKYGFGVYQRIVDDWDKEVEEEYWNSLCEFHLSEIAVKSSYEYNDELVCFGLVPMELLNLIKIRKQMSLPLPTITHELFSTPMAANPILPTGYNSDLDVMFQLIDRTQKQEKIFTIEEIIEQLKDEYGEGAKLFY